VGGATMLFFFGLLLAKVLQNNPLLHQPASSPLGSSLLQKPTHSLPIKPLFHLNRNTKNKPKLTNILFLCMIDE